MSIFKNKACILHHFSFLDWLPTHYYPHPITRILALKAHCLTSILPFLAMCFMDRRGTIYTITAYTYAFRIAFSTILPCVLHHFTLRLAPKRSAFCCILHCILLQMAQNRVQTTIPGNKYSFLLIGVLTLFCTKTNPRENRFFAARWVVGERKGHS